MAVGVLLLTHTGLGQALIAAAHEVIGPLPLRVTAVEFGARSDTAKVLPRAAYALRELNRGDGVLVLTDLYGSTPSNIAAQLGHEGVPMRRVSGVNLPMLLRVLNYAEQTLDELVLTAASGARTGVVIDTA
jgi:PTS system ascorbate-specific IIA component